MGADPRSHHDQDYFLSKRFRRDVEEAEWLYQSVAELNRMVQAASHDNATVLEPMVERLSSERWLPGPRSWAPVAESLRRAEAVGGKLSAVLALHGIRFEELELLDEHSRDLPLHCHGLELLNQAAGKAVAAIKSSVPRNAAGREQAVEALTACHTSFSQQMLARARKIREALMDLSAFLPIWLGNISRRRSMILNPNPGKPSPPG
jgi:hypothetical protein